MMHFFSGATVVFRVLLVLVADGEGGEYRFEIIMTVSTQVKFRKFRDDNNGRVTKAITNHYSVQI
ncbi:uncharacterized protein B0T23DRAFT_377622 [Neurospora hispaniola]|uniref:Secreted protein n=1 Tax=Neurospora hispaniola TaxID=588809 RepID=A0AAJ0IB20_9PEZI|nr:hypothetical protein B0T23DRAFT_377622 [Neurospora hispaniola]